MGFSVQIGIKSINNSEYNLNLFSSAMKINSQYMHVLWFSLKVDEIISLDDVKHRLYQNQLVAFTTKNLTSA